MEEWETQFWLIIIDLGYSNSIKLKESLDISNTAREIGILSLWEIIAV